MKVHNLLMIGTLLAASGILSASGIAAAPTEYLIDPQHTYPSFEGDHFGMSVWRGKFTRTSGKVTLDRAAGTGTADVVIESSSIDFGLPEMNTHATSPEFLDVEKFPKVTYKGQLAEFVDGKPTRWSRVVRVWADAVEPTVSSPAKSPSSGTSKWKRERGIARRIEVERRTGAEAGSRNRRTRRQRRGRKGSARWIE